MARGIFTSAPDLARKLRRYINAYSANARHWKYSDPPPPYQRILCGSPLEHRASFMIRRGRYKSVTKPRRTVNNRFAPSPIDELTEQNSV